MPSIRILTNLSALALPATIFLVVPASASDYPPPPGLYRPLSGEARDDYRSTQRQARQYRRDPAPQPSEKPPAFAPPAAADHRPVTSVERASTANTAAATAGAGSRLPDYLPKVVPGYALPDTSAPESSRTTTSVSTYPTEIGRPPRAQAGSRLDAPRFAPPGSTSSQFSPSAPSSRAADPIADAPAQAPEFANRAPMQAPGYPGVRRFRPPSAGKVDNGGFSSNGEPMETENPALLRPGSEIATDPAFGGERGAYDSRFRPPGVRNNR